MPKMKTRRAAAKRYQMTASGKVKIKKSNLRHILTKMSQKSQRNKAKPGFVDAADIRTVRKLLPYG